MPSAAAIRAGQAFVELFVKDSRFNKGLAAARQRLHEFAKGAAAIGRRLVTFGALAAAPFAIASRTFAGFEDQMKAVQAVSGATGEQFDTLYQKAKLLGRTTSFTAGQVAGGMLELSRAGFKPQETDAAIKGMLDLARATGTDLPRASEIAAGTLRAFNLEASKSEHVADVLVATANNSAQTLEELGEAMAYVAPIAQEYGLTLEETAKAVGVLANMQIKGSMAGTAMRQTMLRLADPSVQAKLAALGVSVRDFSGNLRTDFGSMFLEIGRAMKSLASGERLALLKDLFDQRAAAAAAKLATTSFEALGQAIDNAGGAAARTAEVMDSGLGGSTRRFLSAVEGVAIAVGESLAPALTGIIDSLTGVATGLAEWVKQNGAVGQTIAILIGSVVGLGGAMLVAAGLAKGLAIAMMGWGAIVKTVTAVTAAVKLLTAALLDSRAAGLAVTTLAAHPMVAGLLAVAAAAGLAYGAFKLLGSATRELSHSAADEYTAGQQKRSEDQAQIERLKQLAEKQKLNNSEMTEAGQILRDLTKAYGDFGATLDTTNGKLTLAADGMQGLVESMKAKELAQAKEKLAEAKENLAKLREEYDLMKQHALERLVGGHPWLALVGTRDPEEIAKDFKKTLNTIRETRDLIDRLVGRPPGPVVQPPKPPAGAISPEAWLAKQPSWIREEAAQEERPERGTNLDKSWLERQQEFARDLDWRLHELRLADIQDEEQRALESIKLRYAQEIDEAKRAHATLDNLAKLRHARDMELAQQRDRFRQQRAEAQADRQQQLADDIRGAEIDLIKDTDQRERARLAFEREQRLREAHEAGAPFEEIEAIKHLFRLREQAIGAQAGVAGVPGAQGTFSGFAAARMGQSPWHARLLKGIEEGAKAAKRIEERQRLNQGIPVI